MPRTAARDHNTERAFYGLLPTPGRVLFAKMQERADADTAFSAALTGWLVGNGKTLALRDLAKPFGNYWRDLAFSNAVDDLDTASCKLPALLTKQEA